MRVSEAIVNCCVVCPASLAIVTKKAEEREKILLRLIKRMVKMSMQCSL